MITFKQFISESRTQVMNAHDATDWMENHASGYLKKGTFLFRGVAGGGKGGVTFGDSSVGEPRKSLNTHNFYTLWMDNHPMFHGKPRRGNGFITTTSASQAGGYGSMFLVVPADNAKVGVVGHYDMWDVMMAGHYGILTFNEETADTFDHFDIKTPRTFEDLVSAMKKITLDMIEEDSEFEDSISLGMLMRMHNSHSLYDLWAEMLIPSLFKYTTGEDIEGKGEVWIDGAAMFIPLDDNDISESDRFAIFSWAQDMFPHLAKELDDYWEDTAERIDPDTVSSKETLTHTQKGSRS